MLKTSITRLAPRLVLCAALILPAIPVTADNASDDPVQIDVLDGGLTARGTYQAALRVTLSDGWKTYWRAPGDTGIPPQFDWQGSRNIGAVSITWPTPDVFDQDGLRSIGYKHQLVLPIEITPRNPARPVHLSGTAEIGVCSDICMPSALDFDHSLNADAGRNPEIVAALAQRPYSATEAGVRATTCRLSPTSDGMQIEAQITMPSAGGAEVAVIEPGNPKIWASQPKTRRRGGVLIATSDLAHVSGKPYALDRSQVRITVLGKRHAVDILGCTPG